MPSNANVSAFCCGNDFYIICSRVSVWKCMFVNATKGFLTRFINVNAQKKIFTGTFCKSHQTLQTLQILTICSSCNSKSIHSAKFLVIRRHLQRSEVCFKSTRAFFTTFSRYRIRVLGPVRVCKGYPRKIFGWNSRLFYCTFVSLAVNAICKHTNALRGLKMK
ncbi:hypothetical protein Plhal710r2_c009g0040051 [Plasmopara halstedii]